MVALRVLWKSKNYNNLFSKRKELESVLKQVKAVVLVISCMTCFKNEEVDVGQYGLQAFENLICQKFLEAGVSIDSCKCIKTKGELH